MCGIAGIYSFKKEPIQFSVLRHMNALMTHRGPDAEGFYEDGRVGLCMRRLKVIDLATGDQPIHDMAQSVWIVFNGEIYNYRELGRELEKKGHRFYTHSDTEVILHQYLEEGIDCVHALKGMFAFAIYDSAKGALWIARDRLGIKPLFYHHSDEGFVFASEIKPIFEVPWIPRKMDRQAISHFFSLNYLPSPWTPFEGIRQLPPGHWIKVEAGNKVELKQYWDVPVGETIDESESAALKKIEELLHRSIERRLIADVPLGAFLSGGLDSSTLVYLMKEHRQETIKTFSVGFDHPSYDETPYAREVAKYFGTEHYEIRCSPKDVVDFLPKVTGHADNLLADQAALPLYIVSKLAKEHVTVCLSGDGGDETFIGYPTFHADRYHRIYSRLPKFFREGVIKKWAQGLPTSHEKLSFEYRIKKFIEAADFTAEKAHYWWRTIFTDDEKRLLFRPEFLNGIELDASSVYGRCFDQTRGEDFIQQALYADLKVWLAGNNLYKVDTMSMAHGLEARVPFLDHELVEYLMRLPPRIKFRGNVLKYLLKKFLKGKLPDAIRKRPKSGWHTPIAGWLAGPLRDYVDSTLFRPHACYDRVIAKESAAAVFQEHVGGKRNNSFKLWGLLIFRQWCDQWGLLD